MSIRIELTEQLGDGQFIEIRDPRKLSWGAQKAITNTLGDGTTTEQVAAAEKMAISLISTGYVLDADNKPVDFPITAENIENVPAVVVEEVLKKFAALRGEATSKN